MRFRELEELSGVRSKVTMSTCRILDILELLTDS